MKVDDSNRADFEEMNAQQRSKMPYFSIPMEIFNDYDILIAWARKSIAVTSVKSSCY